MKLRPGMFTQSAINITKEREMQRKYGDVDRSLSAIMFALVAVIDLITLPLTYTGAIVDRLISPPKKSRDLPTSA